MFEFDGVGWQIMTVEEKIWESKDQCMQIKKKVHKVKETMILWRWKVMMILKIWMKSCINFPLLILQVYQQKLLS